MSKVVSMEEGLRIAAHQHRAGNLEVAERLYREALHVDTHHPVALHRLGVIEHQRGRYHAAVDLIRRAISVRGDVAPMHNNLGEALRALDRNDQAIQSYQKALELQPEYPQALNNLGNAYAAMNDLESAIKYFRQSIEAREDDPDTHWNLAMALLLAGNYRQGLTEFEWRLRRNRSTQRQFPGTRWNGEHPNGRTILLTAEQGFGDMIQFFRFAPLLAQHANVIVEAHPELVPLFANQYANVQVVAAGGPVPPYHMHAPLMSVARLVNTTLENIPRVVPYLKADEALVREWKSRLLGTNTLRVGLVWAGRPEHENDRRRSCPLSSMGPLASVPGVTFFSLQKGPAAAQAADPPAGMHLISLSESIRDFRDTAAIIANLDQIICVDTSVAHLAGALGQQVWTMLPFAADWRWLAQGNCSPWYPSMRLLRQPQPGVWTPLFQMAAEALRERLRDTPETD